MKWGKIDSSEIKNWLIIIICILVILGMLVDFISWRTALSILKQELPIGYKVPTYTFLKGYGYIPISWRGNFSMVYLTDYKNPRPDLHDYIIIEFSGHNLFLTDVALLGENLFYGNWKRTEAATEYIKDKRENWEKMLQPFGASCEIWIKINPEKQTMLLFILGEKIYMRELKYRTAEGGCGGGYISYWWP